MILLVNLILNARQVMIVNNFDINSNFWKANPQLIIPDAFNKLYESDKGKDKSSKVMWAIALIYDPASKFFNLPLSERKKIILKDIFKDEKANIDEYKNQISLYEKLTITPAKRQLIEWNRIMDEKSELLRSLKYTTETWEMLEKMLASNTKLYDELNRISESLQKEGQEGVVKGGSVESAAEKGEI